MAQHQYIVRAYHDVVGCQEPASGVGGCNLCVENVEYFGNLDVENALPDDLVLLRLYGGYIFAIVAHSESDGDKPADTFWQFLRDMADKAEEAYALKGPAFPKE